MFDIYLFRCAACLNAAVATTTAMGRQCSGGAEWQPLDLTVCVSISAHSWQESRRRLFERRTSTAVEDANFFVGDDRNEGGSLAGCKSDELSFSNVHTLAFDRFYLDPLIFRNNSRIAEEKYSNKVDQMQTGTQISLLATAATMVVF